MVGNIGSGKTTLVKEIVAKYPEIVVISRDALRYMVGAGKYVFDSELEPTIFGIARLMIKELMHGEQFDILVDETNISRRYREDYLYLAQQYAYEAIAVVMPILDKKTSVDRRMQDPHGQPDRALWEGVWDKFDAMYEEPTIQEGFHRLCSPKGMVLDEPTSIQDILTGN